MLHDLRLALRGLIRAPLASALAIVFLALGIGTNATMFSVLSTTVLSPLPFRDADRLVVTVWSTQPQGGVRRGLSSFLDLQDYQDQTTAFETLAGVQGRSLTFSDTDEPERVLGAAVSWRLFSMLGIAPALGRDFTAADDRAGAAPVVVLSDELWRRRYNADSHIVGRAVTINAQPYTVIGVLSVVPVVDLRQFGMSRTENTVNTFVIITEVAVDGERMVLGALADSVQEVLDLEPGSIAPAPRIGTKLRTEFIKGMGKRGDRFIILLDIDKVFSSDELIMVQASKPDAVS